MVVLQDSEAQRFEHALAQAAGLISAIRAGQVVSLENMAFVEGLARGCSTVLAEKLTPDMKNEPPA